MIYKADDLFQEIPGDPDHVIMNIPPEICEQADFNIGDNILIEARDGVLIMKKQETTPKIYESPDGGKTVYARDFGMDPSTRKLVSKDGKSGKVPNCS